MIYELSPATRQRIIDTAHRDKKYHATHAGIMMQIRVDEIKTPTSVKAIVTLFVCLDRKWRAFPVETVFDAVEQFNRVLRTKQSRAKQVGSIDEQEHNPAWLTD
jgi:hypothetical protein